MRLPVPPTATSGPLARLPRHIAARIAHFCAMVGTNPLETLVRLMFAHAGTLSEEAMRILLASNGHVARTLFAAYFAVAHTRSYLGEITPAGPFMRMNPDGTVRVLSERVMLSYDAERRHYDPVLFTSCRPLARGRYMWYCLCHDGRIGEFHGARLLAGGFVFLAHLMDFDHGHHYDGGHLRMVMSKSTPDGNWCIADASADEADRFKRSLFVLDRGLHRGIPDTIDIHRGKMFKNGDARALFRAWTLAERERRCEVAAARKRRCEELL